MDRTGGCPEDSSNEELFHHFKTTGHQHCFQRLWSRSRSKIEAFLVLLTGDPSLAQDLTQEVAIRVWRGRLSDYEAFENWMYAIARNAVRSEYRRRSRRPVEVALDAAIDAADTRRAIEAIPDRLLIMKCLKSLKPRHREVLLFRELLDFSEEKTAAILGVRVGTVGSRCSRAKEAARKWMERHGR